MSLNTNSTMLNSNMKSDLVQNQPLGSPVDILVKHKFTITRKITSYNGRPTYFKYEVENKTILIGKWNLNVKIFLFRFNSVHIYR